MQPSRIMGLPTAPQMKSSVLFSELGSIPRPPIYERFCVARNLWLPFMAQHSGPETAPLRGSITRPKLSHTELRTIGAGKALTIVVKNCVYCLNRNAFEQDGSFLWQQHSERYRSQLVELLLQDLLLRSARSEGVPHVLGGVVLRLVVQPSVVGALVPCAGYGKD